AARWGPGHGDGIDGEVLVQRSAMQGDGRMRPVARWLWIHVGVPDRACLRRRTGPADLRRYERDHEGGDHPLDGSRRSEVREFNSRRAGCGYALVPDAVLCPAPDGGFDG